MITKPRFDTPAAQFRFCPRCGQPEPRITEGRSLSCPACRFRFFFNSATAAAAFIFHQAQLVLCLRAKEPALGKLDLPGGFIEFDESIEDGLRREIREELNIEVAHFRYLCSAPNDYRYAEVHYKTTDAFFVCEAPDLSDIRPADDVGDFRLVAPAALDPEELAFLSSRRAFAALLADLAGGSR